MRRAAALALAVCAASAAGRRVQDLHGAVWALPVLAVDVPEEGASLRAEAVGSEQGKSDDEAHRQRPKNPNHHDVEIPAVAVVPAAAVVHVRSLACSSDGKSLALEVIRDADAVVLETATLDIHPAQLARWGSAAVHEDSPLFQVRVDDAEQNWPSVPVHIACVHEICAQARGAGALAEHALDLGLVRVRVLFDGALAGIVGFDNDAPHRQLATTVHLRNVGPGLHEVRIEVVDSDHLHVVVWPLPEGAAVTRFTSTPRAATAPPVLLLESPRDGETAYIGGDAKGIEIIVAPNSVPPSGQVMVEMRPATKAGPSLDRPRRGVLSCGVDGRLTVDVSDIEETSTWDLSVAPVDGNGQTYPDAPVAQVEITLAMSPTTTHTANQMQKAQMGSPLSLFGPGVQFENRPPVKPHSRVDRLPVRSPREDAPAPTIKDDSPRSSDRVRCRLRISWGSSRGTEKRVLTFAHDAAVADLLEDTRLGDLGRQASGAPVVRDGEGFEVDLSEKLRDFCADEALTIDFVRDEL